ncbi:hypothetical protein ACO1PF_10805 [Alkalibacterium sp. f15]|uniref:hypothetical protein n=1 Tax=Alkalibacterium sp. f15 TaxID=3414029 RepID=UPI003BF8BDF2
MSFYENLKFFVKNHATHSNKFLSTKPKKKITRTISIQYKHFFQAQDISSNQETIDTIAKCIIKNDLANRYYAGKKDKDIMEVKEKIYEYESFRTQEVQLIPTSDEDFDLYIEDTNLGQLPEAFSKEVQHYLQTTILTAFAYIKGGPSKHYDKDKECIVEYDEPFDLDIYIQFS